MKIWQTTDSILSGAEDLVILNSVTVTVGDPIKISYASNKGGADAADAVTDRVYGLAVGISKDGIPLSQLTNSTDYDGTYTNSQNGDTYVAAADNTSDKKIIVSVVPTDNLLIEATLSDGSGTASVRGTTTGSDQIGYFLSVDTTDSTMLDETTATTTPEQYMIVKNHPTDTSKVIVKCCEKQVYN